MDRHVPAQEIEESLNGNEMMSPLYDPAFRENKLQRALLLPLARKKKKESRKISIHVAEDIST